MDWSCRFKLCTLAHRSPELQRCPYRSPRGRPPQPGNISFLWLGRRWRLIPWWCHLGVTRTPCQGEYFMHWSGAGDKREKILWQCIIHDKYTLMEDSTVARCDSCGFEAPDGSSKWARVFHPPLGRITQCPECGSTDIYSRG